jgi:hypothetical protein
MNNIAGNSRKVNIMGLAANCPVTSENPHEAAGIIGAASSFWPAQIKAPDVAAQAAARGPGRGAPYLLDSREQVDNDLEIKAARRRRKSGRSSRQLVASLRSLGRHKVASAVSECGSLIVYQCEDCSGQAARRLHTCDNRLCPWCASRRSSRIANRIAPIVAAFSRPALLTVTIKNGSDLLERFTHCRSSWSKLARRKEFKASFLGGVAFVESTYNLQTEEYHVHIHALVDGRMPQKEISRLWEQITGDSFIVDIRAIRDGHSLDAAKEACKYPTKLADINGLPHLVEEYLDALKGRRLMWGWGHCFGVMGQLEAEEKECEKEELRIEQEVLDGIERLCPHCGSLDGLAVANVKPWRLEVAVRVGRGWWVRAECAGDIAARWRVNYSMLGREAIRGLGDG